MFKKIKWMVTISIFLIISTIFLFSQVALAKGKWQIGPHYGIWTLNPVKSMIEDFIGEKLEIPFRGLAEKYLGPDGNYTQNVDFNSRGSNLGLEVRFYPAGEDGSFSIGLGMEKSELELTLQGPIRYEVADVGYAKGTGNAKLLLTPTSYHLSLRWDIKASSRLHPYIGFGAGIGSLKGTFTYDVSAELYDASGTIIASETWTDELDLADLPIPLPILQLNLGLNFEITNNLHILLDAGIWNGFLVRGRVCLRV